MAFFLVYCVESSDESSETESIYALKCHISHEVNHLHEGLKHGLKSDLEKVSSSLGRSAVYLKESRINGLPRGPWRPGIHPDTEPPGLPEHKMCSSKSCILETELFLF
ncbi:hypothetical protein GIB67_036417 [Kingdonia uniflora]|uniref:ubiquitinyl hydrolase 1 n=1 Tax=Kingdonia uniflora TaxID=39325 RepID=A0A7J7L433_9MAGN|nr:hypothetical protein GIB67_036417 [Kingdonia uniflora]